MFRSVRMKRLNLLVLERDVQAVTKGLAELAAMHIAQARQPDTEGLLQPPDVEPRLERCRQVRRRLEAFAEQLGLRLAPEVEVDFHAPFNLAEVDRHLDTVRRQLRRVEQSTARAQECIPELQAMLLELEPFRGVALPLEELEHFNFLHFATGSLPRRESLAVTEEVGDRSIILPLRQEGGREKVLAVSAKKSRWALETALEKHGFRPEPLAEGHEGLAVDIAEQLEKQLAEARAATGKAGDARQALRRELGRDINQLWRRTAVEERILEAQQRFGKTTSTYAISGWVPEPDVQEVRSRVRDLTQGRVMIEEQDAEALLARGEEVPTLMRHHWLLRPFQVLVSGYGFPQYNEVEPTLFVALSFLLMFGLMFGDVGHGAAVALVGLAVHRWARSRNVRDFAFVLSACGVSAVMFGFLYGSYFGFEGPALWLRPLARIETLFAVVLTLGMAMISLGLIINIVNRVAERKYFEGILSQYGLVAFVFYWGAIGLGLRYFIQGAAGITMSHVLLFIVTPLALLILREPIHTILTRKPAKASSLLEGMLEGFVEVMEVAIGFVANTASFIRVAAFALSHALLCLATFAVADALRVGPGGVMLAWTTIVIGNVFIILLEGLVVTIQSVRLEYYEFFSKFFSGEGKAFDPLSVSSEQ